MGNALFKAIAAGIGRPARATLPSIGTRCRRPPYSTLTGTSVEVRMAWL